MQDAMLGPAALWALRLALAAAMIAVDDPLRLAAGVVVLSLQIPLQAGLSRWAERAAVPVRRVG